MMRMSESRIKQALTAATIIHFFFAVFRSPLTLIWYDENNWKTASSALRLVVAVGSGEVRIPSALATFGKAGATGTSLVAWLAFSPCEARLGDLSTDSLVNSCCLTKTC